MHEFADQVNDPQGIYGAGQWFPGSAARAELGPPEDAFLAAYTAVTHQPADYPGVQAAAAAVIVAHCARQARSTARGPLWAQATTLDTATLVGRFRIDPVTGMADTAFLRSGELPAGTALGYLPIPGRSRTNVFHLPVKGSGDDGIYSTAADIAGLWQSLFTGRIVPARWVAEMVRPRSEVPAESMRYGLGFWLAQRSDTSLAATHIGMVRICMCGASAPDRRLVRVGEASFRCEVASVRIPRLHLRSGGRRRR